MTEIASAAEVSLATLYSLVEGKDQIFEEVVTAAATAIREDVRAKLLPIADPDAKYSNRSHVAIRGGARRDLRAARLPEGCAKCATPSALQGILARRSP